MSNDVAQNANANLARLKLRTKSLNQSDVLSSTNWMCFQISRKFLRWPKLQGGMSRAHRAHLLSVRELCFVTLQELKEIASVVSLHALQTPSKRGSFCLMICTASGWLGIWTICTNVMMSGFAYAHICMHIDTVRSCNAFCAIQLEILQMICMHQPHFMVLALSRENSSNCYFATLKRECWVACTNCVFQTWRWCHCPSLRECIWNKTDDWKHHNGTSSGWHQWQSCFASCSKCLWFISLESQTQEPVSGKQSSFTRTLSPNSHSASGHDFSACCCWIISGQVNTDQSACYNIVVIIRNDDWLAHSVGHGLDEFQRNHHQQSIWG